MSGFIQMVPCPPVGSGHSGAVKKYSNSSTPDLRFYLASDNSLTTSDGTMALCEDDGDVYIGSKTSYTPIRFTIHTFFLANPAIFALGQATWPDISFSQVNVQLANYECELVDENKINSIYKISAHRHLFRIK